jgi:hypothetical protein
VRDTAGSLDKTGLSAKCHFHTQFALAIQMFAHLTLGDGWTRDSDHPGPGQRGTLRGLSGNDCYQVDSALQILIFLPTTHFTLFEPGRLCLEFQLAGVVANNPNIGF